MLATHALTYHQKNIEIEVYTTMKTPKQIYSNKRQAQTILK